MKRKNVDQQQMSQATTKDNGRERNQEWTRNDRIVVGKGIEDGEGRWVEEEE